MNELEKLDLTEEQKASIKKLKKKMMFRGAWLAFKTVLLLTVLNAIITALNFYYVQSSTFGLISSIFLLFLLMRLINLGMAEEIAKAEEEVKKIIGK